MKRIIGALLSVLFMAGMIGCKDAGGVSPLLALMGGAGNNETLPPDPAPMKYMQYMYDNENGKALTEQALRGMPDSDEIKLRMKDYLSLPVVESLGQSTENAASTNWWEHLNVDADNLTAFMGTVEGQTLLNDYYSGSSGKMMNIVPSMSSQITMNSTTQQRRSLAGLEAGLESEIAEISSRCNAAAAVLRTKLSIAPLSDVLLASMGASFIQLDAKMNQLNDELKNGFEQTNYRLDIIEQWLKEQDLKDVKNLVHSKLTDFSDLATMGWRIERINEIDNFLGPESDYEYQYNRAYASALERTTCLKNRASSPDYKVIPGTMLLSDIYFMRELSDIRLTYASLILRGNDLIAFRALKAGHDLEKLRAIKDGLLSDETPGRDPEYYRTACAVVAAWEITLRAHQQVYYGPNATEVRLENAKNLTLKNSFGTFGDLNGVANDGTVGVTLTNNIGRALSGLFSYGSSLESIFDTAASGAFAPGKFLRMVHNGKNLQSDLGLVPVAKKLQTLADLEAPDEGQFYIDPALGRYVLPRPIYWSKCENADSILKPEISMPGYAPTMNTPGSTYAGVYNTAWAKPSGPLDTSYWTIYPFGNSVLPLSTKGTVSLWWLPIGGFQAAAELTIGVTELVKVVCFLSDVDNYLSINYNGTSVSTSGAWSLGSFHHIYVIWDNSGLNNGSFLTVYVNNVPKLTVPVALAGSPQISVSLRAGHNLGWSVSAVDNIKIWNHAVTQGANAAAWEYNNALRKEDSLHAIYGQETGYRPVLTGPGNGVGYYYLP